MKLALMPRARNLASKQNVVQRKSIPARGASETAGTIPRREALPQLGIKLTPKGPQTKLEVNTPNDRFEQEADRVADEVMRMPDNTISPGSACDDGKQPSISSHHFVQRELAVQRTCTG